MAEPIVVFVTCSNREEAETIASTLLEKRMVACVNFIPAIESWYWWEGKVNRDSELLLVMKTQADQFPLLDSLIRQMHSYSVPEVIALPIIQGSEKYLEWIAQTVNS
jgi:periplasmic divalent cation tolerance protein